MFQTSTPVSGRTFHDRSSEIARLEAFVDELRTGAARWLALIGPRKIGKTSLVLELSRRATDVGIVMVDAQEVMPRALELARTCALRTLDTVLGSELGQSLEVVVATGGDLAAVLDASDAFSSLPAKLKTTIRALASPDLTDELARLFFDLPERLSEALGRRIAVAIDEFQMLAEIKTHDPLPLIRSVWQRHRNVSYLVSGSGRTLLEDMVTQRHSPFFQHFSIMYVEPFSAEMATSLLVDESPADRAIPAAIAKRAVDVLGGHPFYLQLFGEALTASPPPYDDPALKAALQAVLFSRTGRLALYFELLHDRTVGRSSYLAAALDGLAEGSKRITDLAKQIGATTGDTTRYLERLGDVVRRRDDGTYGLEDAVFALWLRWRRPGGSVVPMSIIGDAAEREVAVLLARMGFDLVYQSRASRGSFDLLATRGPAQLAIQVKRSPLPLRFERATWNRMAADAKRFGWSWAVASVSTDGDVRFLDPSRVRRAKQLALGPPAVIENLVEWLER